MIQRPSAFRPMSVVRPAVSACSGTDLAARPFTTAARP